MNNNTSCSITEIYNLKMLSQLKIMQAALDFFAQTRNDGQLQS